MYLLPVALLPCFCPYLIVSSCVSRPNKVQQYSSFFVHQNKTKKLFPHCSFSTTNLQTHMVEVGHSLKETITLFFFDNQVYHRNISPQKYFHKKFLFESHSVVYIF